MLMNANVYLHTYTPCEMCVHSSKAVYMCCLFAIILHAICLWIYISDVVVLKTNGSQQSNEALLCEYLYF